MRTFPRGSAVLLAVVALVAASLFGAVRISAALNGAKGPTPNPDAGLTDANRNAKYNAMRSEFDAHYAQWLAALDLSQLDLGALPHSEINSFHRGPVGDITAAAAAADVIVTGSVTHLALGSSGSTATVVVDRLLKGTASREVLVRQAGGLRPAPDWKEVIVADSSAAPTLLPGDSVLLLLQRSSGDEYEVQGYTGTYLLKNGTVVPVEGNPSASAMQGKTAAEAVSAILAAVGG